MNFLEGAILGIVQGLTEFLPVSSSGHLAILEYFFKVEADKVLFFTVLMHLGTLLSVFVVYRKDIWELILELIETIKDLVKGRGLRLNERPVRRMGVMIIVATIPTGIIGILFNDYFESLYSSLIGIGIGLIITGLLLFIAERIGRGSRGMDSINCRNAIFIGILQGIAICPGISRSGSTLVGGLFTNLDREFAVKFAFLISIPSILGSAVLELPKAIKAGVEPSLWGPMLVGFILSALFGLMAIKLMIKIVTKQRLIYFSYYVWALAVIIIGYRLIFA